MDHKDIFVKYYEINKWGNKESVSGSGSTLLATQYLIPDLELLLKKYNIKSMLDIPCGDFNWMSKVNLSNIHYHGADIVDNLISENQEKYPDHKFSILDITTDDLPKVDLIFCRDCLFHLPNEMIELAINNIKISGSKYLLTTSFPETNVNKNIKVGQWRPINLEISPFFLNKIDIICEKNYKDKSMILVKVN